MWTIELLPGIWFSFGDGNGNGWMTSEKSAAAQFSTLRMARRALAKLKKHTGRSYPSADISQVEEETIEAAQLDALRAGLVRDEEPPT